MAERKNPVWQHFTEPTSGKARCAICNSLVSMGAEKGKGKNTSNVWSHLKRHHLEAYSEAVKERDERGAAASSTQPTVVQMSTRYTRSKKVDLAIVEMIATDNQPFTVVSGVGFKRLVALLEPRYSLKTDKYYRTDLFEDVHTKVENKIKELVTSDNAGPYLAFTTDCWSGETESLMSLTCHFIDKDWQMKQIVLNVKAMDGSHTGEYISDMFLSLLKHWDIETERVVLVLRDSGANMIKGMRLAKLPDLSCSAHTLQLVVNDGISSQRAVADIVAKLKSSATHFNHSVLAEQRLKNIQKELDLPQHRIIQSVPTRWNSTLHMLESMLEQKRALNVYAGEHGKISVLTADQWALVDNLIATLSPLEQITLEMSRSDSTISCIIPCITVLKMLLEAEGAKTRGIGTLRETMLNSLKARFEKAEKTRCLVLATLLDPRYKGHALAPGTLRNAKDWIKEEHATLSEAAKQKSASSEGQGQEDPKRKRAEEEEEEATGPSDMLEQMYANLLGAHGPTPDETDEEEQQFTQQLDQYLRELLIDRQKGQLVEWWKQNASRLHLLAPLARKFLSPPPSSVPSERVFSEVSQIYEKKRYRLTGENAERLCFLQYNLQLLNWDY
ncbi:zinc finger BED domain-containing protein 4-like [Epinephelus fuscoguttatus]|uniref:zinc finger BED domain-containing protein 4-like n=1 Tax=Epinephelus fuscoguttatus TaxID=293821 RepID=UPI0020D138BC|nr:zinc finger BED domain-containing protein 4-like [Epinephelus fuscoguttatus]